MDQIANYMGIGLDDLMEQVSNRPKARTKEQGEQHLAFSAEKEIDRLRTLSQKEKLKLAQLLIAEAAA